MDIKRREYDNNIYIETKLLHFIYIYHTVYFLFILTIQRIMKTREREEEKKEKKKEIK